MGEWYSLSAGIYGAVFVEEFIEKETLRIQSKGNVDGNVGPTDPSSRANIDDYRVKFFYVGS